MSSTTLTVGIAQATPVLLDKAGSIDKACRWIADAGRQDVRLLAFAETWVPGYPFWCDGGTFGTWDHEPSKRLHARLVRESVEVPSADTDALCAAAREAGVAVVIGVNERDGHTLYNTLLFIDERGELLGRHRKLVPTFGERLVHGRGDASGMRSYPMAGASVSGLVCWEHWMPVPRHVLHATGEQIHVAAWPMCRETYDLAARHYAFEGRVFVLSAAMTLTKSDLPGDFELAADLQQADEVLMNGGSSIIGPDAIPLVGPVTTGEQLLVAEVDLERVTQEKLTLDVAGHYSRPDLFDVRVRRDPLVPFREE